MIGQLIAMLVWLDQSGAAYLLMIGCFLAMAALHYVQTREVTRLRKLLRQAMR
jgi:hypothetical protein